MAVVEERLPPSEAPVLRIEPPRGWVSLRLRELWAYRELLYFFVWRDIKVRYKQTVLGASWAILQPLLTMVVFTLFFGRLAQVPSEGLPYPIFSFAALLPWTFFSHGLTQASNSLVGNARLVQKIYFPRLTLPIAGVLSGILDFALAFAVLMGMMFYFDVSPGPLMLLTPVFLLMAVFASLSVSVWLAALNVRYRDIRQVLPFITQIWLFATPVAYSSTLVSGPWRTLYALNPMVGVVEGFRWAIVGTAAPRLEMMLPSVAMTIVLLAGGIVYFRRMEQSFADVI